MAQMVAYGKKPDTGALAIAGGIALGGIALILLASKGGSQYIQPVAKLPPGYKLETPTSESLEVAGTINLQIGQPFVCRMPRTFYSGPDLDVFTYFRIVQNGLTVYGSGISGRHVGPVSVRTEFYLVPPEQPQPPECADEPQSLCTFLFPGPSPTVAPICGAPARPGLADAYLEIYVRSAPADKDGYASPTCPQQVPEGYNPYRQPVARRIWPGKIRLIA